MSWQEWANLAAVGGFVIAIVALAQPWVITAWRKWIRKGKVGIYESRFNRIQVGYTGNGATLTVTITVRAIYHDQFVKSIGVRLVRQRDNATYDYEWRVFQSFFHRYDSFPEPAELPASFLLMELYPRALWVTFGDVRLEEDMADIAKRVRALWEEFRPKIPDDQVDNEAVATRVPLPQSDERYLAVANEAYQEMTRSDRYAELVRELERRCYWEPGQYAMSLRVSADEPEQEFAKQYQFSLTEDNSRNLRNNAGLIIRNWINLPLNAFLESVLADYRDAA